MKTVIRISQNYMSDLSYELFKEELYYLVNETDLEILCKIKNDKFINPVEQAKNYSTDGVEFKYKTTIEAKGYSQSDWQKYLIFHNVEKDNENLIRLVDELKKSFTHMNDYWVEKFERIEIDGKIFDAEPHDYTSLCIRDIEFPDEDDVLKTYLDIYGKDYDEVIINI